MTHMIAMVVAMTHTVMVTEFLVLQEGRHEVDMVLGEDQEVAEGVLRDIIREVMVGMIVDMVTMIARVIMVIMTMMVTMIARVIMVI